MHFGSLYSDCKTNRRAVFKTLLIMKFTIVFLIVGFCQVSARGFSQTVTLKLNNASLESAFHEIEKQSGYSFVYGKEQLIAAKKVSLDVKEVSLEDALNLLFKDQPLDYTISDKYISIRLKTLPVQINAQPLPPPFDVSGRIVNEQGTPLEGITVSIKGTNIATQTDAQGYFKISAPNNTSTLVITAVNFERQEIAINGRSAIDNIVLAASVNSLNEIVITGYSAQRKKDITGAVSVVNTSDLKVVPSANATAQLQGRASGVTVLLNGTPGVQAQVKIRGLGSFSNNNPLYVVDGIQTADISNLAPDDIESMQVLKDAASASIYGVRSSNGVIVITTKKGKNGFLVSYNMNYGNQLPSRKYYDHTVLTPQEQGDLVFLVQKNQGLSTTGTVYGDGTTPVLPDYLFAGISGTNPPSGPINEGNPIADPSLYSLDPTRLGDPGYNPYIIIKANKAGTDWWDLAIRNAPIQNHNITVSNGNDKGRYLLSLNYFNQQAITIYQFYKRYNARMNSEFNVIKGVRIGENFSFSASSANVQGNSSGGNTSNNQEASDFGAVFEARIVPVHTINGRDWAGSAGGFGGPNPVATLTRKKDNRDNNINLLGNVYAEADIVKHLTFRTSFGGFINTENTLTYPFIEYENSLNRSIRTLSEGWIRSTRWILTNQLTYKNDLGKHSVFALVGYEAQKDGGRQLNASATGFYTFAYLNYFTLANGGQPNLSGSNPYVPVTTASAFANVNYEYDGKYLLSALVRRDGSSKFSGDNLYGTFPAVSAGWRISGENFMQGIGWLNDLKLRGSYGLSGNEQAVGANNIYTTYVGAPGSSYYDLLGTNNNPSQGFYNNFVGNVKGKWEKDYSTNIGLDATIFNNSTNIVFDYYEKRTDGLLYNQGGQPLQGEATAFNPAYFNVGGMKNWGVDILLSNRTSFQKDISLNTTLTLTTYKNKITDIAPGVPYFDFNSPSAEKNRLAGQTITRNMIGEPFNTYFGYTVLGIFQTQEQVDKAPIQDNGTGSNTAAPGSFIYKDISGPDGTPDGRIDSYDRTVIGNPNPKFTYGINLDLQFKQFDLVAFFYGVAGKDNYNWNKWFQDFNSNFGGSSKDGLYNSWLPDGSRPDATIPMQTSTTTFSTAGTVNSFFVENASYFRLRNLQIGYTFNTKLISKIRMTKARIFIQATNLFTVTKYSGMDPEVVTNAEGATGIDLGTYPTVRQISVGANINF